MCLGVRPLLLLLHMSLALSLRSLASSRAFCLAAQRRSALVSLASATRTLPSSSSSSSSFSSSFSSSSFSSSSFNARSQHPQRPHGHRRELLRKLPIADVVQRYTQLERRGDGYVALCPFHNDENPSMSVSEEKGLFHCFSCKASGDVVKFVSEIEHCSTEEAVTMLADWYGFDPSDYLGTAGDAEASAASAVDRAKAKRIKEVLNLAQEYYASQLLHHPRAGTARMHCVQRKLQPEVVHAFGLGFSPADSTLVGNLTRRGYTAQDLLDAGIVLVKSQPPQQQQQQQPQKQSHGSTTNLNSKFIPVADRFRGRLTIPIRDRRGDVIGFGARSLTKDDTIAKYINSPTTAAFNKGSAVFGLDLAVESIRDKDAAFVVEGYFDAIALHNAGITNAVALMGTAVNADQIDMVARLSRSGKVYLLLDSDAAGQAAMEAMCMNVLPFVRLRHANVRVLQLPPPFKDAGDYFLKRDKQQFEAEVLKNDGEYWKDWYTNHVLATYNENDTSTYSVVYEKYSDFLARLKSPADRNFYLYRFADLISKGNRRFSLDMEKVLKKEMTAKWRARVERARLGSAANQKSLSDHEDDYDDEDEDEHER